MPIHVTVSSIETQETIINSIGNLYANNYIKGVNNCHHAMAITMTTLKRCL